MSERTVWDHWKDIPWQKRNEIIAFYGLGRSAHTKVATGHYGEGIMQDDGIRENDLDSIKHLSIEDVLALKPREHSIPEQAPAPTPEAQPAQTAEPKKRGRKPKEK